MSLQKLITLKELTANPLSQAFPNLLQHKFLRWASLASNLYEPKWWRQAGHYAGRCRRTALPFTPGYRLGERMGAPPWSPQFCSQNPSATLSQCLSPLGFPTLFFARKKKVLVGKRSRNAFFFFPPPCSEKAEMQSRRQAKQGRVKWQCYPEAVKSVLVQLFYSLFLCPQRRPWGNYDNVFWYFHFIGWSPSH